MKKIILLILVVYSQFAFSQQIKQKNAVCKEQAELLAALQKAEQNGLIVVLKTEKGNIVAFTEKGFKAANIAASKDHQKVEAMSNALKKILTGSLLFVGGSVFWGLGSTMVDLAATLSWSGLELSGKGLVFCSWAAAAVGAGYIAFGLFTAAGEPEFTKVEAFPVLLINYSPVVAKQMMENHPTTKNAVGDFIALINAANNISDEEITDVDRAILTGLQELGKTFCNYISLPADATATSTH